MDSSLIDETVDTNNNRIRFYSSKPIHYLGIKTGDLITLVYTWDELEELFYDMGASKIDIVMKPDTPEKFVVVSYELPEIEDIFTNPAEILETDND